MLNQTMKHHTAMMFPRVHKSYKNVGQCVNIWFLIFFVC